MIRANRLLQLDDVVSRLRSDPRDASAWEQLFLLTWPYVLAVVHRHLYGSQSLADAEDVAQEVFLRLGRAWHKGEVSVADADSLRALLAVMATHAAADHHRRRGRLRRDVSKEVPVDETNEPVSSGDLELELSLLLEKFASQLAHDEQQILELRLQGYEVSEIADRLKVSSRTVDRKLLRIKDLLRPFIDFGD